MARSGKSTHRHQNILFLPLAVDFEQISQSGRASTPISLCARFAAKMKRKQCNIKMTHVRRILLVSSTYLPTTILLVSPFAQASTQRHRYTNHPRATE